MYAHFLKTDRDKTDWITFLDIDEYINIKEYTTIEQFISSVPGSFDGVMFNWVFFGPNGHAEPPSDPIPVALTRRQSELHILTKYVLKSEFLKGDFVDNLQVITDFWHRVDIFCQRKPVIVNVLGENLDEYFSGWPHSATVWLQDKVRSERIFQTAYINHYAFRSERAFVERAQRGTTGIFSGQERWKAIAESNEFEDFLRSLNAVEDLSVAKRWQAMLEKAHQFNVVGRPIDPLISREGNASQSSRSSHSIGATLRDDAIRAINGIYDGSPKFHTADEPRAWWKLELRDEAKVTRIVVYNRIDTLEFARRFTRFTIETARSDLNWQTIYRKNDDSIIGGIDGFPLIVDLDPAPIVKFVRIRLLGQQFLHLDQVDVFGQYVLDFGSKSDESAQSEAQSGDTEESDKALFSEFQSLGDNCEFGGVQRRVGLEPLALLKWCRTNPLMLKRALEEKFIGIEDVENVELTDHLGEYFVGDRRYGLSGHSFVKIGSVDEEKFRSEQALRLRFLKQKFLDDLEDEPQNFIYNTYKLHDQNTEDEMLELSNTLWTFGEHVLVWVTDASRFDRNPCDYQWISRNCIRIYKDEFSTFDSEVEDILTGWRSVCSLALKEIKSKREAHFQNVDVSSGVVSSNRLGPATTTDILHDQLPPPIKERDDKDIFSHFFSLGINCELGIVQKSVGVTKLGLLDWFATHPDNLLDILENNFEGIGSPAQTRIIEFENEYIIEDTRYKFSGHTFVRTSDIISEKFLEQSCSRLQYLKRKIIEELEDGENIFVYKMNYEPMHLPLMPKIAEKIASYGPGVLLAISDSKFANEPDRSAKWVGPNLIYGNLANLAPYDQADNVDVVGWSALCTTVLEMVAERRKQQQLPSMINERSSGESRSTGRNTRNIAFGKRATQSSVSEWSQYNTPETDAVAALDGQLTGGVKFHTDIEENPWWQVDLGATFGITEIRVFNRMEQPAVAERASRLSIAIGFEVHHLVEVYRRETDQPFGGIDGNPLIFKPTIPIPGRFVRIRLLTRNYLHLDQVEVYGDPLPELMTSKSSLEQIDH
jgi:hypothetical protein